jgi:hypothetical protein
VEKELGVKRSWPWNTAPSRSGSTAWCRGEARDGLPTEEEIVNAVGAALGKRAS